MSQPQALDEPLDGGAVLREELRHVRGIAPNATPGEATNALEPPLSALCFSGGGIRSAAFNLGVIRTLAQAGVLRQFDYLSTVSGGGYIGGWLQTLIKSNDAPTHAERLAAVEETLKTDRSSDPSSPLRQLRDFGNFLTPDVGVSSLDTWAGATLYLRNLLLNWAVLLPVFLLAVLAPIFHRTAIWQFSMQRCVAFIAIGLAWLALCWAVCRTCLLLPSHQSEDAYGKEEPTRSAVWWIVGSAFGWAIVAPLLLQHLAMRYLTPEWGNVPISIANASAWESKWLWAPLPVLQLLAMLIGYWCAWLRIDNNSGAAPELFRRNHFRWITATVSSCTLLALALWLFLPTLERNRDDFATLLTQLGPISLVITYLLQSSIYIGLRREAPKADLDREWLARLDGAILATAAGWSLFAFACVSLGPLLTNYLGLNLGGKTGGVTAAGAAASGGAAAWLAKQAKYWTTDLTKNPTIAARLNAALPTLLSVAFLFGLVAVLSAQLQATLGSVITALLSMFDVTSPWLVQILPQAQELLNALPPQWQWPWWPDRLPLGWVHVAAQVLLAVILFGFILKLSRININRFSMHGTYRNRLVRAFLGTTRQDRRADWFTGFDEDDNPKLAALRAKGGKGQKLFPVINLALNRSSGGPTGRAERMAASYTATPLHCGSEELAEAVVQVSNSGASAGSSYIATADFAYLDSRHEYAAGTQRPVNERGISLGSVITASGAAASPHAGYHTNPLTAFIMTLFNVRLGLWLPNHAVLRANDPRLTQNRPPNAITALLNDLIGRTTLDSKAIYLSDGGHFDNLGLYEMLRRRCRYIVVIDAGADPDCEFSDLGMAIRKAEIDLPVQVTMGEMRIRSRKQIETLSEKRASATSSDGRDTTMGVAIGTIKYMAPRAKAAILNSTDKVIEDKLREEAAGVLIYIKPSLLADIPAAARAYAREHEDFPHETTADQFFSESQFESYRVLGWWQTNWLTGGKRDFLSLDAFFAAAQRRVANSTAERRARTWAGLRREAGRLTRPVRH